MIELLDRGWELRFWRNRDGSYTASGYGPIPLAKGNGRLLQEADGPTPEAALEDLKARLSAPAREAGDEEREGAA